MEYLRDRAIKLMQGQQFSEAVSLFRQLLAETPDDWSLHYMAGQCYRFLKDFDGAMSCMRRAVELNKDEPDAWMGLGIVMQKKGLLGDAVQAFVSAIEADNDNELAYNSLAYTQKLMGKLDYALHNYDAGLKAFARRIAKKMDNNRDNPIYKYQDTDGHIWTEYVIYAATYLCSTVDGIERMAMPSGEQAEKEERLELHGGMYWLDLEGGKTRYFLPNYFNTFREIFKKDKTYSLIIYNKGEILGALGRTEEADLHFKESDEFA